MSLRPSGKSLWSLLALLPVVFLLASCGGDSGEQTFEPKEVASAFEEASGGFEFEEAITLVEGADAYAPSSDASAQDVQAFEEELGEGSVLWQVLIFTGEDPPSGEEAAKEAAFASKSFKEVRDDVWIGDSGIAYAVNGNVVVNGPALNGDPEDETLKLWEEVLDGL